MQRGGGETGANETAPGGGVISCHGSIMTQYRPIQAALFSRERGFRRAQPFAGGASAKRTFFRSSLVLPQATEGSD